MGARGQGGRFDCPHIHSRPYWGFGLLTKGYLNVLEFSGSEALKTAVLTSPPRSGACRGSLHGLQQRPDPSQPRLEPFQPCQGLEGSRPAWPGRPTGRHPRHGTATGTVAKRLHEWLDEVDDESTSTVRQHRLMEADEDLERARKALNEDHAPGVERALARAEAALIEVDPMDDAPLTLVHEGRGRAEHGG